MDARGRLVEEWTDELGLCLSNTGEQNTFDLPGRLDHRSHMGLLMRRYREESGIKRCDAETLSDHKYIAFYLGQDGEAEPDSRIRGLYGGARSSPSLNTFTWKQAGPFPSGTRK